jgi:flagellum-specific ATP synthase
MLDFDPILWEDCITTIEQSKSFRSVGRIDRVQGTISVSLPAAIGELVQIENAEAQRCLGEVIGFDGGQVQIMPFGDAIPLKRNDRVTAMDRQLRLPIGFNLLGRVINSVGDPIDDKGPLRCSSTIGINHQPPGALTRQPINEPFITGQRTIDGLLTIGKGQRVGLFAGSGVGKSTLLGEVARFAHSDLNVVALIGERGREVLPFIKDSLGPEGMARSVVIVSTANESPLSRVRAAETATAIASWFRSQSKNVFFMLDSLTRFAMAQRELGLMLGEPPTSRGYTPSVFQKLAVILEQLGNSDRGSITGLLTILVDGDDMNDPIADSARSILDGHIVLDRNLANSGHFPAINVLPSASRLFGALADKQHAKVARRIRQMLANYNDVIDLVQVGAYQKGISHESDIAIELYPEICHFLQQDRGEPTSLEQTKQRMQRLFERSQVQKPSVVKP